MKNQMMRKIIPAAGAALCALLLLPQSVSAVTLEKTTLVYILKSEEETWFHITDSCPELNGQATKTKQLCDMLDDGWTMCETCAASIGLDDDTNMSLTSDDLPLTTSKDASKSSNSTSNNSNTSKTGNTTDSSKDSTTSSGSKKTTTSGSESTTTSSGSGSKKTASSSGSSGSSAGDLMTESQRRSKFRSRTNPKREATPVTVPRPASAGFAYADFAKFNSYNSDNHLGGTPIYLLGTIMDVQPVKEVGSMYWLAIMVNDCDGYQWYMRLYCDKTKYELFKNQMKGKAGYIYGLYAGYSGVTNRPMMDMTVVTPVGGVPTDMRLYQ